MSHNAKRANLQQIYTRLIDNEADRIAMEFAVRSNEGMSLTCDASIHWLKRELAAFAVSIAETSHGA